MNDVMRLVVVRLKIPWERGQDRAGLKRKEVANLNQLMISDYWTNFWERESVFVLIGMKKKAFDPFQGDMGHI